MSFLFRILILVFLLTNISYAATVSITNSTPRIETVDRLNSNVGPDTNMYEQELNSSFTVNPGVVIENDSLSGNIVKAVGNATGDATITINEGAQMISFSGTTIFNLSGAGTPGQRFNIILDGGTLQTSGLFLLIGDNNTSGIITVRKSGATTPRVNSFILGSPTNYSGIIFETDMSAADIDGLGGQHIDITIRNNSSVDFNQMDTLTTSDINLSIEAGSSAVNAPEEIIANNSNLSVSGNLTTSAQIVSNNVTVGTGGMLTSTSNIAPTADNSSGTYDGTINVPTLDYSGVSGGTINIDVGGTINTSTGTSYTGSSTGGVSTNFNVNGSIADINQQINGNTGKGTINIKGDFITKDEIYNFDSLNVQNQDTLFINDFPIYAIDSLVIDEGAVFEMRNDVTVATNFTVDGTANLNSGIGSLQNGVIRDKGVINLQTDNITFDNGLTINDGGKLNLNGGYTLELANQNIINNGEIIALEDSGNINSQINMVNNLSGNGKIIFNILQDKTNSFIDLNNGTATLNNTSFVMLIDKLADIKTGDTFNVMTNLNLASSIAPLPLITTDNERITMTATLNNNILQFLATVALAEISSSPAGFSSIISSLNSIVASNPDDKLLDEFITTISNLSSENLTDIIKEQISPDINDSSGQASHNLTQVANNMVTERIISKRNPEQLSYNSGEESNKNYDTWTGIFHQAARQDKYKRVAGHNIITTGFMIGGDLATNKNYFGIAFGAFKTSLNSRYRTKDKTKINTIKFMIYDSINFGKIYVDGIASIGKNTFKKFSSYDIDDFKKKSYSNHKGKQYSLSIETSLDYAITPVLSFKYFNMKQDNYKEYVVNADSLSRDIKLDNKKALDIGIGVKFTYQLPKLEIDDSELMLSGNIKYYYDFIGDYPESITTYKGSVPFSSLGPRPSRHTLSSGLNVKVTNNNASVNYLLGASLKEKFYSLFASVKFKYYW